MGDGTVWEVGDRFDVGAELANVLTHVVWERERAGDVAAALAVGEDSGMHFGERERLVKMTRRILRGGTIRCRCPYCQRLQGARFS